MKLMVVMIAALSLIGIAWLQGQHIENGRKPETMSTVNDIMTVAPALEKYAQGPIAELWKRPGLTPRDRSIVTIAALIARNQTIEMPYYFQSCARQRRQAARDFRDHHTSRLLFRLGECAIRGGGGPGCLCATQDPSGSASSRFPQTLAAGQGVRGKTGDSRR
jgi:alkylhydroperoxidase/carboxymuconolactone decarboxylase family protein YurZ